MGTHMKTTIDIADGLLGDARAKAAREGTTLRAVVEDGLRRVLTDAPAQVQPYVVEPWGDPDGPDESGDLERLLGEARAGRRFPELDGLDEVAGIDEAVDERR